jgi:hypothetical protein
MQILVAAKQTDKTKCRKTKKATPKRMLISVELSSASRVAKWCIFNPNLGIKLESLRMENVGTLYGQMEYFLAI